MFVVMERAGAPLLLGFYPTKPGRKTHLRPIKMYVSCNAEKTNQKRRGTREKFNKLRVPLDREASPSRN
jgi:hypothetical protein